jgi:hypothetical protein
MITQTEPYTKGFTCWGQFVAMLFSQLGRAHSPREITRGLRSCESKLKHLRITAPSHSTLAYANERRPPKLHQQVFLQLFTSVGTSANAVKIQILTALIAMLILRFLRLRSKCNWSPSNLVALLRMNLFTHRDLWDWINKPFEIPPVPYQPEQLQFCFC